MAVFSGNGSLSAPSFTFSSDTDTGMFRKSADVIGFSAGGVEAFTIDATGSIDLGSNTEINVDGSASFATGNILLNADGSSWYLGAFGVGNTSASPNISLNAGGSATFADDVQVGGDTSTGDGIVLRASLGLIKAGRTDPAESTFASYTTGNGVATAEIYAGGGSYFAGDTGIGGTSASPNIELNASGAITATGSIVSGTISPGSTTTSGAFMAGGGQVAIQRLGSDTSANLYIDAQSGADSVFTVGLAGETKIGGTLPASPNITLAANGTAEFKSSADGRVDITGDASGANAYLRLSPGSAAGSYITNNGGQASVLFLGSGAINAQQTCVTDTGNFLVGGTLPSSPNITLDADGSASFAGAVVVGNEVGNTSTETGIKLFTSGAIYAAKDGGNEPILYGMLTDGNTSTSRINADGSAIFANGLASFSATGALSKASGSFRIPHPLPALNETHQLVHSFIEGPQADNIYRGQVTLEDGVALVDLDVAARMTEGTFVLLNTNISCFTSNETDWVHVRGSVSGSTLTIEAQDSTSTATVSWMVVGERHDEHMLDTSWTDENGRVITEPLKPVVEEVEEA